MSDQKDECLRHYTNVDALFKILESGGLKFAEPSDKWEDKNDRYCVEKYSKIKQKKARVLCFCNGIGNIHHWSYFHEHNLPKSCEGCRKGIACHIRFKNEFKAIIEEKFANYAQDIQYCSIQDLQNYGSEQIDILPYLKRSEYRVEQEFRVLCMDEKEQILKFDSNMVEAVVLLLDPNCDEYKKIKHQLEKEFPYLKGHIQYSGVHHSCDWETAINNGILKDTILKPKREKEFND